jgi:hypothetical protein
MKLVRCKEQQFTVVVVLLWSRKVSKGGIVIQYNTRGIPR